MNKKGNTVRAVRAPRTFRVWVRPTVNSELILHDGIIVFSERGSRKHSSLTVPATLTLDAPKRKRP